MPVRFFEGGGRGNSTQGTIWCKHPFFKKENFKFSKFQKRKIRKNQKFAFGEVRKLGKGLCNK